jgi:hypothetical protein
VVANTFLCIEYFPYPSCKFKAMRPPVASQQYGFDLANHAIDRNAIIVLMRAKRLWEHVVPRLSGYPQLFILQSPIAAAISRKNCVDGFPKIEAILRNAVARESALLIQPNGLGGEPR